MKTYVTGVLTQLNIPNVNNRVYTTEATEQAIEKAKLKIEGRGMFSEFLPDERNSVNVNLDNIGGVVKSLFIQDDNLCAKVEVIPTRSGDHASQLFEQGLSQFMLSLKAYGSVSMIGSDIYVNELDIISIDLLPFDNINQDTIVKITKE